MNYAMVIYPLGVMQWCDFFSFQLISRSQFPLNFHPSESITLKMSVRCIKAGNSLLKLDSYQKVNEGTTTSEKGK